MKNSYVVRAQKFIKQILPYLSDMHNPSTVDRDVWVFNFNRNRKVKMDFGAVRICLMTSDYVVKWDYDEEYVPECGGCEKEFEVYDEVKADGYGYLFAESNRFEYQGIVFNIMPRIKKTGYRDKKMDIDDLLTADEWNYVRYNITNDLHKGNWGLKNGRPVIIDYAFTLDLTETW